MLHTIPEVIAHVRSKYQTVRHTATLDNGTCVYAATPSNGIGCAIGCLLPPEQADQLEVIAGGVGINAITGKVSAQYWASYSDGEESAEQFAERMAKAKALIATYVDLDHIDIDFLTQLQSKHDASVDAADFLQELDNIEAQWVK